MSRVFISHRTADRPFVEAELLPLLYHFGIDTWYCKLDIAAGDVWEREIRWGLDACDWFIIVLSPRAVSSQSPWIHAEVSFAFQHRSGRIIPVLLEPVAAEDVHLRLPTLQHVDFTVADRIGTRLQLLARFGVRATEEALRAVDFQSAPSSPRPLADPAQVEIEPVRIDDPDLRVRTLCLPQVEPPLAEEVLRQEGLLAGLAEAIAQVEQDSHAALLPGKQALEAAERQWQRLHDNLDAHPPRLAQEVRQQVETLLAGNPDADFMEVYQWLRLLPPVEARNYVHRARNVARARRAWEDGRKQYETMRQALLARLHDSVIHVEGELVTLQERDQGEQVRVFIGRCSSLKQFEAEWQGLMTLLERRRYRCGLPDQKRVRERLVRVLDEAAWKRAEALGTEEAYEDYLGAVAGPVHAREAQEKLAGLKHDRLWLMVKRLGTSEAIASFVEAYPRSPHAEKARQRLRLLVEEEKRRLAEEEKRRRRQAIVESWERAREAGTPAAYEAFLRDFPEAPQVLKDPQLLSFVRKQREAEGKERKAQEECWEHTREAGTLEAYEQYLRHYPAGNRDVSLDDDSVDRLEEARRFIANHWREEVIKAPYDRAARRNYLRYRTPKLKEEDRIWNPPGSRLGCVLLGFGFAYLLSCMGSVIGWEIAVRSRPDIVPASQWRNWGMTYFSLTKEQEKEIFTLRVQLLTVVVAGFLFGCGAGIPAVVLSKHRRRDVRRFCHKAQAELGPLPNSAFQKPTTLEALRREFLGEEAAEHPGGSEASEPSAQS